MSTHQYQRVPTHDAVLSIPNANPLNASNALNNPNASANANANASNRQPKRLLEKQVLFPADADDDADVQHQQLQMQQQAAYKTTQKEEFLRRVNKDSLPRATAYCTCSRYNLDQLMEYLFSRKVTNGTSPRRYDEALYTPYSFSPFAFSLYDNADPSSTANQDGGVEDLLNASSSSSAEHMMNSLLSDPSTSFKAHPHSSETNGSSTTTLSTKFSDASFTSVAHSSTLVESVAPTSSNASPIPHASTTATTASTSHSHPTQNLKENGIPPPPSVSANLSGGTSYGDFSDTIEAVGSGSYKDLVRRTTVPELIFFDFGVVVMWGLTEEEEYEILEDIRPFEEESIDHSDLESEKFHYLYSRQQQARIYNDIITLISPTSSVMIKLTISYAFAQSAKLTLFEGLIEETIESTRRIPTVMAETGKIHMHRKAINKKIGQLFIMRINVNLVSNVLDTPEIFWSEPAFEPLYTAIRGYLEINQRVDLVNQRVAVISDLLAMLKDNLTSTHGEQLEWIVIFLISIEILIGLITISIDLSSYFSHGSGTGAGGGGARVGL
ncbi:UNVERIFIED_CONTAM: hypothetical protein HDU68_005567 [Siphonaria sp. JEL0065]|nr:hypothetical protein HDU68_005567 [Siphonaria sp. JEL0065]